MDTFPYAKHPSLRPIWRIHLSNKGVATPKGRLPKILTVLGFGSYGFTNSLSSTVKQSPITTCILDSDALCSSVRGGRNLLSFSTTIKFLQFRFNKLLVNGPGPGPTSMIVQPSNDPAPPATLSKSGHVKYISLYQ